MIKEGKLDISGMVKRRKSKTKRFIKKLKPNYHHHYNYFNAKRLMPSDSSLIENESSNDTINVSEIIQEEHPRLFRRRRRNKYLASPVVEKLNNDLKESREQYEKLLAANRNMEQALNEIIHRHAQSLEKIRVLDEKIILQSEKIDIQDKLINEQQSIIDELELKKKEYELRFEKIEDVLLEHEKKMAEMQKIIDSYQNSEIESQEKEKSYIEQTYLQSILDETSNNLSSIKFKYLIKDFLSKIENCEKKEKECVEQVDKLLSRRRDETKEIHNIFDEIQKRLNYFGVKKYDEIIDSLEQYKKYINVPISELVEMEKLDLSKKHIYSLANGFSLLNNIKNLNLMNNYLSEFPIELTKMTNLVEINLSYNDIINIPPEIKYLTNLQKLAISNNSIITIPKEIGALTKLYTLNLSNNKIRKIPEEFFELKNLKWIFLNNNLIQEIPKDTLSRLPSLQILYIGNNNIKVIHEEIKDSKKIVGLYDKNNCTDSVPREFFNLSNLTVLNQIQ